MKLVACSLFFFAGAAQLVSSVARPRRLVSAVMLLCFGSSLTLTLDGPYLALDRVASVPNTAELVSYLTGLTGIGVMTYLLLDVSDRSVNARRRQLIALVCVLTAATGLFASSDVPAEAPDFLATYGRQLTVLSFWALSATYALGCLVRLARTVSRSTQQGTRRDLVHGMRLAAVGGGFFGAVFIALKTVDIGGTDGNRHALLKVLEQAALVPGMLCLALGLALPLSARMTAEAARKVRVRRALIRLRPLRRELVDHDLLCDGGPSLSSGCRMIADVLGSRPDARLLRRVVEIRDALLLCGSPISDLAVGNGDQSARLSLDLLAEARNLGLVRPEGILGSKELAR